MLICSVCVGASFVLDAATNVGCRANSQRNSNRLPDDRCLQRSFVLRRDRQEDSVASAVEP